MINQAAVEIICREGGLIVLAPLSVDALRWIKAPKGTVMDAFLSQAVGVDCVVAISKAGSDRARKALGIEG